MIETVPSGTILHGNYRIERVLGSGGFGHVYLALNLANNQPCALKEYLVTGSSGQEQLQHEARVLSHLHHPNLPAFSDAFIERGRYYIALSYIEGNDLTDLIRVTRQRNDLIPIAQMLHWLLAICDAVMFLHSQHPTIIHRDIKPDNIRITSNGTAVLVDLGNAKAAADGARTLFFIRHQGTPGYAPPEQYPGGTGTDARSDIYAIGGTLYFALTTQEPPSVSTRNQAIQQQRPDLPTLQEHLANNPPEESLEDNARQFRLGVTKPTKPAPRHSRHLAQLGQLPPEALKTLNMIIQRAMAMRPRDRYQYVADLANDLRNVIALLPPPSPDATRARDDNSTQPNLDEAYEALQRNRSAVDRQRESGTQPMGSNVQSQASITCPRCQTSLPAGTPFCSHCGAPLSSGPSRQPFTQQASLNAAQPGQAVALAQTRQAGQSNGIDTSKPYTQSVAFAQQERAVQQQQYAPQMDRSFQSMPTPHGAARSAVNSPSTSDMPLARKQIATPPGGDADNNLNLRKIIPLVIGLVILILIIFFMLIR
jgi:Serine/threonine protein kinase